LYYLNVIIVVYFYFRVFIMWCCSSRC